VQDAKNYNVIKTIEGQVSAKFGEAMMRTVGPSPETLERGLSFGAS
jgi:hypothetical protein